MHQESVGLVKIQTAGRPKFMRRRLSAPGGGQPIVPSKRTASLCGGQRGFRLAAGFVAPLGRLGAKALTLKLDTDVSLSSDRLLASDGRVPTHGRRRHSPGYWTPDSLAQSRRNVGYLVGYISLLPKYYR